MIVPGSNTLNLALSVLGKQSFDYIAFLGRTSNDIGIFQDTYDTPLPMTGSVQPVQRSMYEQMGLDFQKNYHTFYLSKLVGDVARGKAGDKFTYDSKSWQCLSTFPWHAMDGWTECTCIEIPNKNTRYTSEGGFNYVTEDGTQFYIQE